MIGQFVPFLVQIPTITNTTVTAFSLIQSFIDPLKIDTEERERERENCAQVVSSSSSSSSMNKSQQYSAQAQLFLFLHPSGVIYVHWSDEEGHKDGDDGQPILGN